MGVRTLTMMARLVPSRGGWSWVPCVRLVNFLGLANQGSSDSIEVGWLFLVIQIECMIYGLRIRELGSRMLMKTYSMRSGGYL